MCLFLIGAFFILGEDTFSNEKCDLVCTLVGQNK